MDDIVTSPGLIITIHEQVYEDPKYNFFTIWLKHVETGMSMPYGRSWKRRSTADKHAKIIKDFYRGEGVECVVEEHKNKVPYKVIPESKFRGS